MKRQIYLEMKSLEDARDMFFNHIGYDRRTASEWVQISDALGRITSEPIFAGCSSPAYHSSAMDGIAVRAEKTYGATEKHPSLLTEQQDYIWINTGQPMPDPFNAVIMVEKLHQVDETRVEIRSSAHPWQNVRKVGEDIVATQLLFPQNHRIRSCDLGALISGGLSSVQVWEKPVVAIIPTGSELISHKALKKGDPVKGYQIIEYNSVVLAGMVREADGVPVVYDIVPDREDDIRKALRLAVDSGTHMVIINAGSSSGSKDYTVHVINEAGKVLVHGVAMMPGKPTILGMVKDKPVVGNPGYPVSAIMSFEQFVKPLIYSLQGRRTPAPRRIQVWPTRDIPSRLGLEEFLRVSIGKVNDKFMATPLERAAGAITTLTRAEGIIRIPALSEGITQAEAVTAELLVDEQDLNNTLVIIGSHDITIDILADEIRQQGHNIRIASGNVGSLGGLMAHKKGACHISGSHLLDTETGEYNISYIKRYLKGIPVSVFNLVQRDQGLIVAKENPKGIQGIHDLVNTDISFVNRQAGSGTRILLDYKLNALGLTPESIKGYDHEEFSHMNVAVDVLSNAADCGMGIYAAARALNLDFIPLEKEQYDLIIPDTLVDQPNIQVLLTIISSPRFRKRVASLGGYDPSNSGRLWKKVS